tara:strand:- start:6194 stop:6436 length:243 start_codon:yes stop_codon:yes gene_type:complete
MLFIPDFYIDDEMTFDEACQILRTGNSVVTGLMKIQDLWDDYCAGKFTVYECDDDFYSEWRYELNAFNIVFAAIQPIVGG